MEQPTTSPTPTDQTATATQGQPVPNVGTTTVSKETTPVSGEAGSNGEAATKDDSFTQLDPNSLPPELKSKYDSMLSDYKKKTAEIAEQRRQYESYTDKVKFADMVTSDPEFVDWFNKKYSSDAQNHNNNEVPEPIAIKRELDTVKASLVVKDFKQGHPDFDQLDADGLISGYVRLNPPTSERDWTSTLKKAYEYAKSTRDKWVDEGRKEGLQRVSEKANSSTIPPSSTPAPAYSGDPKNMSVSEAVALAMKGIRIS